MVQNGFVLQGADPNANPISLGLTTGGLADVLGKLAHEETITQGTGAVETGSNTFRVIGSRLRALRLQRGGGASADQEGLSRLGVFVNGNGSFGDKDGTTREEGFDFHTVGMTAGADYRVIPNLIVGLAFDYFSTNADIDFALGDVASTAYGLALYGTFYVGDFYADARGGVTWNQYDTNRRIVYAGVPTDANPIPTSVNRTASGDTDGRQFAVDVAAGYDFHFGPFTATPYGWIGYLNLDIDGYRERGALGLDLEIRSQKVESLQTALGARLARAFSTFVAVLVPQVRGEWRHEFKNDERSITAKYINDPLSTLFAVPTDSPDRNFFALGAGVSAVFPRGVSAFVDYETVLGLEDVTNHQFTAGLRVEF